MDGRTTLERELRDYKRETKAEMERMADKMQEQERMLRAAGLIA